MRQACGYLVRCRHRLRLDEERSRDVHAIIPSGGQGQSSCEPWHLRILWDLIRVLSARRPVALPPGSEFPSPGMESQALVGKAPGCRQAMVRLGSGCVCICWKPGGNRRPCTGGVWAPRGRGKRGAVDSLTGFPVSYGLCIQEREEAQVTLLPGSPVSLGLSREQLPTRFTREPRMEGGVGLESALASSLYWPGTKDSGVYIFNYSSICLLFRVPGFQPGPVHTALSAWRSCRNAPDRERASLSRWGTPCSWHRAGSGLGRVCGRRAGWAEERQGAMLSILFSL